MADAVAEKFQLADTTDGLYALKCRTQYNGTYIEVSKRIDSASGKIAVAYEPIIQGNVMDSKSSDEHEYTDRDFADDLHNLFIESSDPEIASVDPVTGKITTHKPGAVTITVKAAQSDLCSDRRTSYP